MRVLDLFCGAGGASRGYDRIGVEIVGVDIHPQPNYPYTFVQADACTYPLDGFDLVHASPPCQGHSYQRHSEHGNAWMLNAMIERMRAYQPPAWVVENVDGTDWPWCCDFKLCASSFAAVTRDGSKLFMARHRKFWSNIPVQAPPCRCRWWREAGYRCAGVYGSTGESSWKSTRANGPQGIELMGIDWMNRGELSQAIPPVYTWFILNEAIRNGMVRCESAPLVRDEQPYGTDSRPIA